MRLYTRTGAAVLDHPEFGHFEVGEDGAFSFPNALSDQLHGFAIRGEPLWETDIERQHRIAAEELRRMRDPATLYEAVAKIVAAAQGAPAPAPAPSAKPAAKRAAATK